MLGEEVVEPKAARFFGLRGNGVQQTGGVIRKARRGERGRVVEHRQPKTIYNNSIKLAEDAGSRITAIIPGEESTMKAQVMEITRFSNISSGLLDINRLSLVRLSADFEPPFCPPSNSLPAPMVPVDSPPSCFPASLNPLSPVLLPPVSQSSSSPLFSRPATPWPHAASHPTVFSPSISPSFDPDYPPLSAASCRRRSIHRSSPSPTVTAPLVSEDLSPSPSTPFPTDFQQSISNLLTLPPSFASSIPDVAPIVPVGPTSQFAPSCLAESFLKVQPSSVLLPDSECGGVSNFSNNHPCPVGPSTSSSGSPSGLMYRPGALETVVCSFGTQAPPSGALEPAGLLAVPP